MTAVVALVVVVASMLAELHVSTRHERVLRGRGAVTPPDPVYPVMRWAYPGVFLMMAIEGLLRGPFDSPVVLAGIGLFVAGKALKTWAIVALGVRWTYRVLVLPGEPLVSGGPYRWLRHPNYVAVVAELVGFALVAGAGWSGVLAVLVFGALLRLRIRAEEQALGLN